MTSKSTQQVIIVGGGAASWWLARELSRKSISTTVIDQVPTASFSSTRNQGWLQSGALFALSGDTRAVEECLDGYQFLKDFGPEFVNDSVPCMFLFEEHSELTESIEQCQSFGLSVKSIPSNSLVTREPILKGSTFRFAMEVDDRPVDTHGLLSKLVGQVTQAGVQFQPVDDLASIEIEQTTEGWDVRLDKDRTLSSHAVVLATGTLIPKLLRPHQPVAASQLSIERIAVMVIQRQVATSMLITPLKDAGPNLVPFGWPNPAGASVCLSRSDRPAVDERDFRLDCDSPDDHRSRHMEALGTVYTGLAEHHIDERGLPIDFYGCQKLKRKETSAGRHSRGAIVDFFPGASTEFPLVAFYAGKFTSARVAAKECADQLAECLGADTVGLSGLSETPAVARQPYFGPPSFHIHRNGTLIL